MGDEGEYGNSVILHTVFCAPKSTPIKIFLKKPITFLFFKPQLF